MAALTVPVLSVSPQDNRSSYTGTFIESLMETVEHSGNTSANLSRDQIEDERRRCAVSLLTVDEVLDRLNRRAF